MNMDECCIGHAYENDSFKLLKKGALFAVGAILTTVLVACEPYDPVEPYATGTLTELPTPSLIPTVTPTPN